MQRGGNRGGTPDAAVRRSNAKVDPTVQKIENLRKQREERRRAAEESKRSREAESRHNEKMGRPGDVDFQRMIDTYRADSVGREGTKALKAADMKICICVRKRPVNPREVRLRDYDSVTCQNPFTVVHDCKLKVDGITKYLDNTDFRFDYSFSEEHTTNEVYSSTTAPLVEYIFRKGRATVFAYGQTGSGKTYTMAGIQRLAAHDVFRFQQSHGRKLTVYFSCFEIYGGRCQDLLNQRKRLNIREDGKGEVQIAGLEEVQAETVEDMLQLVEEGNSERTTHATEVNDESSRSHGICQIVLRDSQTKRMYGKLSLIDLAGSERGADTKSHNRQRRLESAEINKSLLALKECIRALDGASGHVPYRASKLTLVLKDSFTNASAKTVMIAAVSPCASSADHTLNTLRYADRVKEKSVDSMGTNSSAGSSWGNSAASPANANHTANSALDLSSVQPEFDDDPAEASEDNGSSSSSKYDKAGGLERDRRFEGNSPSPGQAQAERQGHSARSSGYGQRSAPPDAGAGSGAVRGASSNNGAYQREQQSYVSPNARHNNSNSNSSGSGNDTPNSHDADIAYLHKSLRSQNRAGERESEASLQAADDVASLHECVSSLFEEEENLLNAHMNAIQENAELLTEEGQLLARVQGEDVVDYDIDAYAARLDQILERKVGMIEQLREQLRTFRQHLQQEEQASQRVARMPLY